jgi:hypothetical protein
MVSHGDRPLAILRLCRKSIAIFFLLIGVTLMTACTTQGQYDIQISGSTNHDLQGTLFYESTTNGRQVYIEEIGPGDDMRVLTISFPSQETPTNLRFTSQGPVTASYHEFIGGTSRQYWRNISGNLSLLEAGDIISGVIDVTAFAPDSNNSIQVNGTFEKIGLQGSSASSVSLSSIAILLLLMILVGVNFIFQFYVGQVVYAEEGASMLKCLRGTRTFIRGWQQPQLRSVMILWSSLLISLILILCGLGALAIA